ncbi:MAG: ABC transporter ATP-binding protein/permease [Lachnospiraceae bacterium]
MSSRRPPVMAENEKLSKGAIRKLSAYCRKYMAVIILALILACAGAIFNVMGPDKLSDMTNIIVEGIMTGIDMGEFENIAFFLLTIYILGFVFNYIQGFIMSTVTQRVSRSLRSDISDKINRLPLKYFDSTSFGNVLSRVTNDVDMIAQTLNNSLSTFVISATTFLGALIMMFYTNWIMALSAIISTIFGFSIMMIIMKKSQKHFVAQQRELGSINGHIEEIYSGHNVVKAYNDEERAEKQFNDINDRLYESAWKSQFLSGMMMPLMGFIGNFGYVVVCVIGAVLTHKEIIEFGTIVAFMIYIRLFTNPLSQMAQVATNMQSASAAAGRVFEFLEERELDDESHKTVRLEPADTRGDVEFKNVAFGYDKSRIIIHDFSVKTKAGQKIAIVGPTGAGKTTIVNLLMRFYDVNSGEIRIDGISTKDITRENVHELFCMVLQDTWLFEGTIKENIIYSKEGVREEQVVEACKAVGLHHFIKSLPDGYDTILNDKANLSAGQKQLITIARAMIDNAPLLILDEATSSVDTRTEILIQEAMDKLTVGKTSFVIAHRLSTIKNADLILVMKDGDIIETGNHEELLSKKGFYADLYMSQFAQ